MIRPLGRTPSYFFSSASNTKSNTNIIRAVCKFEPLSTHRGFFWFLAAFKSSRYSDTSTAPHVPRPSIDRHNLVACPVATIISRFRYLAGRHLAPSPHPSRASSPARAIQRILLRRATHRRHEVRPVAIRAKGHEIQNVAIRAFHAMANTRHERFPNGTTSQIPAE